MSETAGRAAMRIDPETAWTVVTDSPLKGLALAREAGTILVWDEGNQLYLFDIQGESLSCSRVPSRIVSGAISDDGSLIALLVEAEGGELLLLDADFSVAHQKPAPSDAAFVTIDPHGRYVAVGTRHGLLHLINRYGRPAGRVETIETIAHFCFIPDRPMAIGAASMGMMLGLAIDPPRGSGPLEIEILWQERMMSTVGRLTLNGDGSMVLASCYTLGIQRFDLKGRNEGAYHLGGTVSHAVPDFPGRTIAAATLEGELAIMNSAGNVRWRTTLPRPAIGLEIDPLGRYVIYGHSTGEVVRLDLFAGLSPQGAGRRVRRVASASVGSGARAATGAIRSPNWIVPAVDSDQQAEAGVLAVVEDPPLIALFTSPQRLHLFGTTGDRRGPPTELAGIGRGLRTTPGWLAAATDRQVLLCDLRRNSFKRLEASFHELTHLAIRPDDFGLVLVQERDRIGRLNTSSRWVWKQELTSPVEELAIGPYGFVAATTTGGTMLIFDPAGEYNTGLTFDPTDPPLLVEAPVDSPPHVAWITLTRRAQLLRGHDLRGQVVWEHPIPWEGWALHRLNRAVVAAAADGQAIACDGSGERRFSSTSSGEVNDPFFVGRDGSPLRLTRKGMHLICSSLDGRVRWRAFMDEAPGPLACGPPGIALMLGRSLAWFHDDSAPD